MSRFEHVRLRVVVRARKNLRKVYRWNDDDELVRKKKEILLEILKF